MHSHDTLTRPATARNDALRERLATALVAAALGLALLYVAGFAEQEVLHNAAHDTRHSAAFPCH